MHLYDFKIWTMTMHRRLASATLIIEDETGRALIVKAHYKSYWTFPGGIIDKGETPKQAAIRETLEEVGLEIDSDSVEFVAVVDRISSVAQTYQFVFRVVVDADKLQGVRLQKSEIAESRLVTKQEVRSGNLNLNYGKVIDNWALDASGYFEQGIITR